VEPPPLGGRIPQLDGLRGLAILLVLVWHYIAVNVAPEHGSRLYFAFFALRITWSGVDLFFVLSGFLIGGILIDARESPHFFKPFYARRFFRIVPIYAIVLGLFALGCKAGGESWWGTGGAWFFGHRPPWYAFALFVQNIFTATRGSFDPLPIGITWSLAVEEQFYVTLPLLIRYLPRRRLLPVLVATVAVVPVARSVAFYTLPHGGHVAHEMMPFRADALLLGAIAALLVRDPASWEALVRHRSRLEAAAGFLAAGLLVFIRYGWTTHASAAMCTVGYSWIALFYTCVLLLALTRRAGRLSGLLQTRWLRGLGAIAYGTYLFHIGVEGICFGLLFGRAPEITRLCDLGATLLAVAITLLLAQASWTFFEKRMVRLGHRFRYEDP
jgi:peptidoglycan/LPS O-acetylase OafA/YrhL